MFEVTSPNAQHAVDSMSNLLSDLQQLPMPSPNHAAARKQPAKKTTPEKKPDPLTANKLARRRSQDFAAKIAGWNQLGGGIAEPQHKEETSNKKRHNKDDEIVVVVDSDNEAARAKTDEIVVVETQSAAIIEGNEGNATAAVATRSKSRPTTPKTPRTPGKTTPRAVTAPAPTTEEKKTGREVDLERKAWVRRKSKPQVEVAAEVKEASAPKKRVVSDGHWRRDRAPSQKEGHTPDKENERELTPKPVYIRKSIVNVGLKVPVSHQDFSESEPEPEPVRVRPLRSRSPNGRERTPDYESRGTKVYIKRRTQSRQIESESSYTAPSSNDKSGTFITDITTPSSSPRRPNSAPREALRKSRSREDDPRSKSVRQSQGAEDVHTTLRKRSRTIGDTEKVKRQPSTTAEAFAKRITQRAEKQPPTPVPKVFGNRIEGWLDTMPDPFDDSRSSQASDSLDLPRRKTRERLTAEFDDSETDRGATRKMSAKKRSPRDEDERRHSSGRKERRAKEEEEKDELPPMSPTATLKRRGARHHSGSPLKNRMSKEKMSDSSSYLDELISGALREAPREKRKVSSGKKDNFRIPSERRLATIASNETLRTRDHGHSRAYSDDAMIITRLSDGDAPRRGNSGLKRRPTKHADLMSVLSRDDGHTIVSARSMRRSKRKPDSTTIAEVMNEVSADELKYQRELRTLVEGVIPVLLQHVVSNAESSSPHERVSSKPTSDSAVTRPIVEMGVALERLKTTHKRIPLHEPSELISWAEGAAKAYAEYMAAWRLGFKDIVVNLAPADVSSKDGSAGWDHDLPRNKNGDLVDGAGERVDVAHLLKRPLVRLKYLAKAFKNMNHLQPSPSAGNTAVKYQDLVAEAKMRVNEEQARLEDEAASSIDPTRARDPRSLAPITGVNIDPTRSVRARDYFDMELMHSSGQQLGCKIEIICRDDAPDRGKAGDLLFCEVSVLGRWLLFPPLPHGLVSARMGDKPGELVVMVRGFLSNARQWREIMSLQVADEQTCSDWLEMLGSSPMPPRLNRRSSFNELKAARKPTTDASEPKSKLLDAPDKNRDPSPREIEVPIGERVKASSRIWDASEVNSVCTDDVTDTTSLHGVRPKRYAFSSSVGQGDAHQSSRDHAAQPPYYYDSTLTSQSRPQPRHVRSRSEWTGSTVSTERTHDYSVWMPTDTQPSLVSDDDYSDGEGRPSHPVRPGLHRRTSSVPSMDMPSIPRVRDSRRSSSPSSDRERLPSQKRTPQRSRIDYEPSTAPPQLQQRLSVRKRGQEDDRPPAPPTHAQRQRPLSMGLNLTNKLPSLTPAFMKKNRRPSSPLKHEYAPSSGSNSLSNSDYSSDYSSHTSQSDTEDDEIMSAPEDGISTVGDLKGFHNYACRGARQSPPPREQPARQPSPKFSMPGPSLAPSESASQSPYRTVPTSLVEPAKTVASIFCWSERGSWDSLHPEECQIFVSPGLIEAFDLKQANSVNLDGTGETPSAKGIKPLVALELTPLVPLRRSTAVDISVRSPPSASSLIRTGNNVMFRARSPEDCEKLYALINRARIENPTYIALQNARGPVKESNWGDIMDQRNAQLEKRRSWWNLGSRKASTYRSKGSRPQSTAATESSIGTMNTAFSALRSFSRGSKFFNIAKSTITSKDGTRSTNSDSLGSGVATPTFDPSMGTPLGITNAKIRLYIREAAGKWRDMGAGRLTVMLPPRPDPSQPANPRTTGLEKRILITGKSEGETLLDVTLGESAFERIARTGIALSIYEEFAEVGHTGGVLANKTTVYMIQMKSVSCNSQIHCEFSWNEY